VEDRLDFRQGHRQAPPIFQLDEQALGQDFLFDDPAASAACLDGAADGGQLLGQLQVHFVLEAKAAFEAAAAAGDFRRV
jgi:hypothetical protein